MQRFWFNIERLPRPTAINLGCGITANNLDEAKGLFRQRIQSRVPDACVKAVREIDSLDELEQKHVRPNIGDVNKKGIWFPQGY